MTHNKITLGIVANLFGLAHAENTTLGATPQMGWNSWNKFHCDIEASIIEDAAQKLVDMGLHKNGYQYVIIDDCWQAKDRVDGHVVPDPNKFPDMKAVGDSVHAKGLKFGMYSSAGTHTCGGFPGGLGHEVVDADDFASYGIDYLKYDNCYNKGVPARKRYGDMSSALRATTEKTGRDIFFSICNWGDEQIAEWGYTIANSWRTTHDIEIYSQSGFPYSKPNQFQLMKGNFLRNSQSWEKAGPGHWNDPDMLQVGNNLMSHDEEKTHFALWAFAKAPLIIGCDLTSIPADSLAILQNQDLIDINQDQMGQQCKCAQNCDYGTASPLQVFTVTGNGISAASGKNVHPYVGIVAVNWDDSNSVQVDLDLQALHVAFTKWDVCEIYNLWDGSTTKTNGGTQNMGMLAPHASLAIRVKCLPF